MKSLHLTLKGLMALLLAMSLTACLNPFSSATDTTSTSTTSTSTGSYQTYYDECYVGTPVMYDVAYCQAYANSRVAGNSWYTANVAGATASNSNVGNIGSGQTITSTGTPLSTTGTTTGTTTGGTTTGTGSVSCNFTSSNTTSLTQCVTYSSTSGVTSCAAGSYAGVTTVASCSGTNRCVYNSSFTIYYGGTMATSAQTVCSQAGGTWY